MRVFSYWTGPISWMERLAVVSAQSVGHDFTVFTDAPGELKAAGITANIEDARDVVNDPAVYALPAAYFSDYFRVEGLGRGLGTWVDMDVMFLRTLPDTPHIFAWESDRFVCGAVLRLPVGSPLLEGYLDLVRRRPIRMELPWWTARERFEFSWRRARCRLLGKPLPEYQCGPRALTDLVIRNGMAEQATPTQDIYPIPPSRKALQLLGEGDAVLSRLAESTSVMHLWRSIYVATFGLSSPSGDTWLGRQCRSLGVL